MHLAHPFTGCRQASCGRSQREGHQDWNVSVNLILERTPKLTSNTSLDTGIDYTHPALGGKIGPGNKIGGGYDLVGDDYDGV